MGFVKRVSLWINIIEVFTKISIMYYNDKQLLIDRRGCQMNTEDRLSEIERKLDDLNNKLDQRNNNSSLRFVFRFVQVISIILILLVLLGVISFFAG